MIWLSGRVAITKKNQMLKGLALVVLSVFVIQLHILFETGHIDPCDAAYAKLEWGHVNSFKNKRRELAVDDEEQILYDYISNRDILQCYRIVLFNDDA